MEDHADTSVQGRSRALPVEHLRAVIEVKSSLEIQTVRQALGHLTDLRPLLAGIDAPTKSYKRYLPAPFVHMVVFFELHHKHEADTRILNELYPDQELRGYQGCLVLRDEHHPPEYTGRPFWYVESVPSAPPEDSKSNAAFQRMVAHSLKSDLRRDHEGREWRAFLMWDAGGFARFAFDLLAMLKGTYQPGFSSSLYGNPAAIPEGFF